MMALFSLLIASAWLTKVSLGEKKQQKKTLKDRKGRKE
jgi:hypothetical protein